MKTLIVLVVTVLVAWPGLGLAGDGETAGGAANERTTVKSSKSNSSERVVLRKEIRQARRRQTRLRALRATPANALP